MSNNPFDESPWSSNNASSGSRYGNAYDAENHHNAWSDSGSAPPIKPMPSPSKYRTVQNAWSESNKTEFPEEGDGASTPLNAYQYSGTRLAEQEAQEQRKTQVEPESTDKPASNRQRAPQVEEALPQKWDKSRLHPSKLRLLLRVLQLVSAVGSVGFAAGASPFSGQPVPLDSPACLYFLYALAILTIIWGFFHVFFYLYRLALHGTKLNRIIMTAIDALLAIMWGVGTIVEIAKYRCPPGDFNHWCDFYNVSIFWGMVSFILFVTAVGWDIYGNFAARQK